MSLIGTRAIVWSNLGRLLRSALVCAAVLGTLGGASPIATDGTPPTTSSTAVWVDAEDRMTVAEYAKAHRMSVTQVNKNFAATGRIRCPDAKNLTGSLTAKNNMIVTSAHGFHDKKGRLFTDPRNCHFITKSAAGAVRVPLSANFLVGGVGPDGWSESNDWMVIQLEREIPGVEPYRIADIDLEKMFQRNPYQAYPVTAVAAFHADWPTPKINVKTVADCKIKRIFGNEIRSNCDAGPGSSGGAYLYDLNSGKRVIAGIYKGGSTEPENRGKRRPFNGTYHFSIAVMVAGPFLTAIRDMASMMTTAQIQQALAKLGYRPGPVDGAMGGRTRSAIQAFQRDNKLAISGQVSVELSKAITVAMKPSGALVKQCADDDSDALEKSIAACSHIIANAPDKDDQALALSNRCRAYNDNRERDKALEDCNLAIDLNPKLASAYYARGEIHLYKGDYDTAVENYTQAIDRDPKHASAYWRRGNVYYRRTEIKLAITDYDRAIKFEQEPSKYFLALMYKQRGNAHEKAGHTDRSHNELALADFKKAAELKPDNTEYKNDVERLAARVELYKD